MGLAMWQEYMKQQSNIEAKLNNQPWSNTNGACDNHRVMVVIDSFCMTKLNS